VEREIQELPDPQVHQAQLVLQETKVHPDAVVVLDLKVIQVLPDPPDLMEELDPKDHPANLALLEAKDPPDLKVYQAQDKDQQDPSVQTEREAMTVILEIKDLLDPLVTLARLAPLATLVVLANLVSLAKMLNIALAQDELVAHSRPRRSSNLIG